MSIAATAVLLAQPVVVRVQQGGFQWIDAAIGAAALAGLLIAATGLYALYLHRKEHR